ncbi:MAG TPA: TIGR00341 family protein [Bacteroidetes bacterium]|nr:TIGR00341 family protein [Bacteroidota bacterium]
MNKILKETGKFLNQRFSLHQDQEREKKVVAEIKKGVEFQGINVWILIFAIMVASVGLNVNSAAVVIGAMLISPLMGPIMGIGLGIGITDLDLIKKAAASLAVMVVLSVLTSWLYFFISPLAEAQSELLSRTTPTIWDVFIGLFGGLAGIVATASKERGNVIPGVAIATALMPPLCTAGYGLAIGNMHYFVGAFYLFSINAVFICFSTLLIVRFLRFKEVTFISPEVKRKVRLFIGVFVVAMVVPSIYIAQNLVRETLFNKKVETYVRKVFNFPTTEVIKYEVIKDGEESELEVSLMGDPLNANTIANLESQLSNYELQGVRLLVKQGPKNLNAADIKSQVLETFLTRNLDSLRSKDAKINYLKKELLTFKSKSIPVDKIAKEAVIFDENIKGLCLMEAVNYSSKGSPTDTVHIALTNFAKEPKTGEIQRFEKWLKQRIESDSVRVLADSD